MRICSWKDGGSENESNQVVILAINSRLRNRWVMVPGVAASPRPRDGYCCPWEFGGGEPGVPARLDGRDAGRSAICGSYCVFSSLCRSHSINICSFGLS